MALNFPAKIYQILENESVDVVRWLPNGGAFRIVDHGRFEREIIPKYFRHNQISSVQRQLNLYGFKCVSRGEDKGAFFHPKFRRGDWEIVKKITRYAPMKKPDEIIDPTRPDDFVLPVSNSPLQVNGGGESIGTHNTATTSTSTSTATSTASGPSAPHSMYHHHISAHAFQNYANTFHRPYDPFGYNEIPPFPVAPPLPVDNSMYSTARRPPAWAWNGGPVPQHYANAYLMRQSAEQPASSINHQASKDSTKTPVKATEPSKPDTATKVTETATTAQIETTKSMKEAPSYMNIVNDVVLIDPDFDLDEEFDFLNDVVPAMKDAATPYLNEAVTMKATPLTCEIGVNTDISQATSTGFYIDF